MRVRRNPLNVCLTAGVVASLLLSCTNMVLVRPVEPGASLTMSPGAGIVFGRIQIIRNGVDELGEPGGHYREFGWSLTHAGSGARFASSPLTGNGSFVLILPTGQYQVTHIEYDERLGTWEGRLLARFTVHADQATYLGTWEIQMVRFASGGKISGRVVNHREEAREEFNQTYAGNSHPIVIGLLESAQEGYFSMVRPKAEQ